MQKEKIVNRDHKNILDPKLKRLASKEQKKHFNLKTNRIQEIENKSVKKPNSLLVDLLFSDYYKTNSF